MNNLSSLGNPDFNPGLVFNNNDNIVSHNCTMKLKEIARCIGTTSISELFFLLNDEVDIPVYDITGDVRLVIMFDEKLRLELRNLYYNTHLLYSRLN